MTFSGILFSIEVSDALTVIVYVSVSKLGQVPGKGSVVFTSYTRK